MEVILLERIKSLGNLGQTVSVKRGFGRNYLLPQGKAVSASKANAAYFETIRADLEQKAKDEYTIAEVRTGKLEGLAIIIPARASEEGKLYGSVGVKEITHAVEVLGHTIDKQEVQLPLGPFRSVGDYNVELHLHHGEFVANIKLSIVNE